MFPDPGEYLITVDGCPDGGRGGRDEVLDPLVLRDPHRLRHGRSQPLLTVRGQLVVRIQVLGQQLQLLLVRKRRQRARARICVDDQQVDRVRADVQHPKSHGQTLPYALSASAGPGEPAASVGRAAQAVTGPRRSGLMSTVTSLVPFGNFPESRSSCHPSAVRSPDQTGAADTAGTLDTAGTPDTAARPVSTPGDGCHADHPPRVARSSASHTAFHSERSGASLTRCPALLAAGSCP